MTSLRTSAWEATKQYNLRNADFDIPRFSSVHHGKHSLRYLGPHLWNKLDKANREKSNVKSFKNRSKSKDLIVRAAALYLTF